MQGKINFNIGDLFAIPLQNRKFLIGRIMFIAKEQITQEIIKEQEIIDESIGIHDGFQTIRSLGGKYIRCATSDMVFWVPILIEVYSDIIDNPIPKRSEVLISGISISPDKIELGEWPIIGNVPVNPNEVEFPETIDYIGGKWYLNRGEIGIQLPDNDDIYDIYSWHGIDVKMSIQTPLQLNELCSYYLRNKIEGKPLNNIDFRFNDRHGEIYKELNLPENEAYYDFALRFGFDLTRLY